MVRCMGGHSKTMRVLFHNAVKVQPVVFVCGCEERKPGDTGDISIYILHTLLPRRVRCGVIEHACLKTV